MGITNLKALVIGAATIDTIIEYKEMQTMSMQKKDSNKSFMLLEEGAKIEVKGHESFSGGGATNASVNLRKQNIEVSFFGKIGDDFAGKRILDELNHFGVDTSNIKYSKTFGTATSYVIPSLSGDRTIFAYRGANVDILTKDLPKEAILNSDFVYITSLSKSSAAILPEIVSIASQNNIKIAINPGYSQLEVGESFIKESMFGIDIMVMNYQEANRLMLSLLSSDNSEVKSSRNNLGNNLFDTNDAIFQDTSFRIKDFFKLCLELGPRIIAVTDGENGVHVATKTTLYHTKAIQIENVVNTLGAGDAFSSTFCANIYKGKEIKEALKLSLINASKVIQYPDAKTGLQSEEDLTTQKNNINNELDNHIRVISW